MDDLRLGGIYHGPRATAGAAGNSLCTSRRHLQMKVSLWRAYKNCRTISRTDSTVSTPERIGFVKTTNHRWSSGGPAEESKSTKGDGRI